MASTPVWTGGTRFDIGESVRRHRGELEAATVLGNEERRVLSAIALCRTAALGGHIDQCRSCGHEHPAYNSCRNRHCPKCQALAQEEWIHARSERLLAVRHFHVVFTLPAELRVLAQAFPRDVFNALFASASATLLELGRTRLGGVLGATMVLHTWTRELLFHPHVHAIVTAGGLCAADLWVSSDREYLFPVKMMGLLLRAKMLDALRRLYADGKLGTFAGFERLITLAARKSWVVYAKKPFRRADHVLKYLGRYTHRVGISNSRLTDVTDDHVTFRTKGAKTATVSPVEFLRRFVTHVLPQHFVKIRHYGLYAGANLATRHRAAVKCLVDRNSREPGSASPLPATPASWIERLRALTGRDISRCPICDGPIVSLPVPRAASRDPPSGGPSP